MPDWSLLVLLLSVLLLTAAALDTEEKQKESYGSSNVSVGPGPPLNVVTMPVGANTLSVSWDPPAEPPRRYTIEYLTVNTITYDTTYDITELESCETYAITVASVYDDVPDISAITSGTTNAPVPPPPQYCSFTAVTPSNVTVVWRDPELVCDTFNHSISWSWDVLWSDEEGSGEVFSDVTSAIIDNLSPYTNVTVDISVISTGGAGLPTTCWTITSEATPGPPSNMVLQLNSTSVTVTWDPPEEENGKIIGYKVTWDGGNGHSGEDTVDYSVLSYTIQNLIPCPEYTISVSANTSMGWGTKEEDKAVIPNYLPVDALECNGNESREVKLAWSLASPECPVSEYSLAWNTSVVWSNQHAGNTTTVPGTSTSFLIDNLQPYSEIYACLIVEAVEGGASCCTTTTQEEVPGPPVNLSLEADKTSLLVSWDDPEEKNGEIIAFQLTWEDEDGNSYNDTVENTVLSYTIESITLCHEYSVAVAASTSAGWGAGAQDQAHIPNYLSEVRCGNESREVDVTWHLAQPDCPVSQYLLTWNYTVMWGSYQQGRNQTTLAGTGTSTVITHLEPYTRVGACLSVEGDARGSLCCSATSQQELASEPRNLTVFNLTSTQADLSWLPPDHLNGELTSWHIALFHDGSPVNHWDPDKASFKYTIKDLQPHTGFQVTLQVRNGAGLGAKATTEFTTPQDNSPAPIGVIIGASVGGVVVLVLLLGGITFYFTRRYNKSHESNGSMSEILEDQLYLRRESQVFGGLVGNRRPSQVRDETGVNGDVYSAERRPSQALYTKRNNQASIEPWKRPSQVLGARKQSQAYLGQRRPSQVQSTTGTLDDNFGQRRPSQVPAASGSDYTNFGQRRPSEVHDARNNSEAYPGLRRSSQVPGANRQDAAYPGLRRASEVTIGKDIDKNNFPRMRRASEAPGLVNSGNQNYHGQRRASEAPGLVNSGNQNYHGQRRASEAPGLVNSGNYHGQRRASEAAGLVNRGNQNYHGQRRASEAPGLVNSGNQNYHGQRRASEAPGLVNSGNQNYRGQRRASEMPGRSYYEMQSHPK